MNSCGNKTIKHIMFGFNFVFVITGIIMVAVGASVKAYYYPYETFLDNKYFSLPNMLIATGSLIFFISFLGCYGAMRENWFLLFIFSVLLTIIFIFELSVGIAGYVLRNKTSDYLDGRLKSAMNDYKSSPAINRMWDIIQEEFQCCGISNYKDWNNMFENKSLPVSCCPMDNGIVGAFYCNSASTVTTTTIETTTKTEETSAPTTGQESTTDTSGVNLTTVDPVTSVDNVTITEILVTTTESSVTTEVSATTTENSTPSSSAEPSPDQFNLENDTTTTPYPTSSSDPYQTGCHSAFGNFVKQHAVDIGAVGIALAVIQLGGIFLSFYLSRQLKNGYYST